MRTLGLLAVALAACGTPAVQPADAPIFPADAPLVDAPPPDGCVAQPYQACATDGARCASAYNAGYVCTCTASGWGWICNPPACPDVSNGPVTGACTQPGLLCSITGEFAALCVAPEEVWVGCVPFSCQETYQYPKDGDPCCGSVGGPPEEFHCDEGCTDGMVTTCDCDYDDHWHCTAAGCPDAGSG